MAQTMAPLTFVGRRDLIERLVKDFTGARPSRNLLVGGPGYGKTALAAALVAALGEDVPRVTVHASEALTGVPFGALERLTPPGTTADARNAPIVLRALQMRLREEALSSGATPLVIVEDANALDEHSAAALAQAAITSPSHLLLLARPTPDVPKPILTLWSDGLLERHQLPLLTPEDVHELCVKTLGGEIVSSAARILARESGGHPFALLALLDNERRLGRLAERGGVWVMTAEPTAPDPVLVKLLKSKIAADSVERPALEALSLAGSLPLPVLMEFGDAQVLDDLEAGGIISVEPNDRREARLAHPIYGRVIRRSIPQSRRKKTRTRILELTRPSPLAQRELAAWVVCALDSCAVVPDRWLLRAAVIANSSADPLTAARAAAAVRGGDLRGPAAVQSARAHFALGRPHSAEWLLRTAESGPTDLAMKAEAAVLRAQIRLQAGADPSELQVMADAWSADVDRTVAASNGSDDHAVRGAGLARLGAELLRLHARVLQGDLAGGEAALERIIVSPAANDEARMVALAMLGELLTVTARPDAAVPITAQAMRMLQDRGRRFLPYAEFVLARHLLAVANSSRWSETDEVIADYLEHAPSGLLQAGGIVHLAAGWVFIRRGSMRQAHDELRLAIEALRESDADQLLPLALGLGAYAAAMSGQAAAANAYADSFLEVPYRGSAARHLVGAAHAAAARGTISGLPAYGAALHLLAVEAEAKGLVAAQQVVHELIVGLGDSSQLTQRQRDIVALAASGLSNREIARTLHISTRTVQGHLCQIFAKLGITSREELSGPAAAGARPKQRQLNLQGQ
jgi:DNA-binding CsgD family transcriptional regulator